MNPVISLVAFEERVGGFVFVRVPNERGRYVRTDVSVVKVPCSHCRATVGEPCRSGQRYGAGTHADRRTLYQQRFGRYGDDSRVDVVQKPRVRFVQESRDAVQ